MEVVLMGGTLLAGGMWLKYKPTLPTRARLWYWLAAWAESNGDAAVRRVQSRRALMENADRAAEVQG